jgi:hypothetical protein
MGFAYCRELHGTSPYFPAQARAAIEQLSVDAFSEADWAFQRQRHPHGDDQIRMLIARSPSSRRRPRRPRV